MYEYEIGQWLLECGIYAMCTNDELDRKIDMLMMHRKADVDWLPHVDYECAWCGTPVHDQLFITRRALVCEACMDVSMTMYQEDLDTARGEFTEDKS